MAREIVFFTIILYLCKWTLWKRHCFAATDFLESAGARSEGTDCCDGTKCTSDVEKVKIHKICNSVYAIIRSLVHLTMPSINYLLCEGLYDCSLIGFSNFHTISILFLKEVSSLDERRLILAVRRQAHSVSPACAAALIAGGAAASGAGAVAAIPYILGALGFSGAGPRVAAQRGGEQSDPDYRV